MNFDNSGRRPLRVPGFGGIPVDNQLPVEARFAHGVKEWRQSPVLTAQELAMVAVMDRLTDKPSWFVDVFDDDIVAQWYEELRADQFIIDPRLMKHKTWSWCVQELRDKAIYYKENQHVRVLDTGTCVCKAESAELQSLSAVFRQAVVPLVDQYEESRERLERIEKSSIRDKFRKRQDFGANVDAGSDNLSIQPQAPINDEEVVDGPAEGGEASASEDFQQDDHIPANLQDSPASHHTDGPEHLAAHLNTAAPLDLMQHESDDSDASDDLLMLGDDEIDDTDGDEGVEDQENDADRWSWNNQTHPANIAASAHMVSSLVDPLLYPLCYGKSLVLQDGGTVNRNKVLSSYSAARAAPIPSWTPKLSTNRTTPPSAWSQRYQSLPCEVAFAPDDDHNTKVTITSYINNLHPDHVEIYGAIEQVLGRCIKLWNDCLVRGQAGLRDGSHLGELGPVPARIITYGVEWENEMPEWTTAFRVPAERRKQEHREALEELQRLPEGSRKRKRHDYLENIFSDVVGREQLQPPPRDSHLWQLAKEYLMSPEEQASPDGTTTPHTATLPDDWDESASRTWDLLAEKARRLVHHKQPEPGTAFSYQEWKLGLHASRPIVEKAIQGPPGGGLWLDYVAPPHVPYVVSLQDQFREDGLQVLVEISSVELTVDKPAYAPDAAARTAAFTKWAAAKFAKATAMNTIDEEVYDEPDTDGWHLAGRLNEHIVGVAVFAFDVDNVTEPRVGFRQRVSTNMSLHRHGDFWKQPENASVYYDPDLHGPANMFGKENDTGALTEILGVTWRYFLSEPIGFYNYQHIGSLAMPQGRLIAFPNTLDHRLEPFQLIDDKRPGHYRWLTLYLVDPHYRVCSTRNVPPQQHDWWAESVGRDLVRAGLPKETVDHIMGDTDSWPMGVEEAHWHREQIVKEGENEKWR